MRKLIYSVTCTADGFIADADGACDFFRMEGEHAADLLEDFPETVPAHLHEVLGVPRGNRRFDAVLMGRSTWEVGASIGLTSPYPQLKQYVFSRTLRETPDPAVELVADDAVARVRALKEEAGKDVWLCGGAALAHALFEEIDELILKVDPVVIGSGVPLFRGRVKPARLEVTERRSYANGFVRVHARVVHPSRSGRLARSMVG
jgi:dihydrofolate reductase